MGHPYEDKPDHSFWRKAVADKPWSEIDLVGRPPFRLGPQDVIASAGSCFAQNLAKHIRKTGWMNFLQSEPQEEGMPLFSANYGNVYTTAHLEQLVTRAISPDDIKPCLDPSIAQVKGRFHDLFRSSIYPDGFTSVEELWAARKKHLAAVRGMFRDATVFVFTMGLTEYWQSVEDESVYPVCPQTLFGSECTPESQFINMDYNSVVESASQALQGIWSINPDLKVILTVSPVPLTATYTDDHVLVATSYSKSVLRAACGALASSKDLVSYFPSYEIITSAYDSGSYFLENKRSVAPEGVDHVMRCFRASYLAEAIDGKLESEPSSSIFSEKDSEVICDDDDAFKSSGF